MQKSGYRRRKKSGGEGRRRGLYWTTYHWSSSKRGRVIYMCVLQLNPFASPSMFLISRTISQIQSSKIWKCTSAFCVQSVFLESLD